MDAEVELADLKQTDSDEEKLLEESGEVKVSCVKHDNFKLK